MQPAALIASAWQEFYFPGTYVDDVTVALPSMDPGLKSREFKSFSRLRVDFQSLYLFPQLVEPFADCEVNVASVCLLGQLYDF